MNGNQTAEAEDQEQPQAETHDGPVLDMSDAAVKKLIKTCGRARLRDL